MFMLLVQFRDVLSISLVTPMFRPSCFDKDDSREMRAAMNCHHPKFTCMLLNWGCLGGKPQVFITISSLHFFSLTVYIKFMPAEHNLFTILVGHTWEKAYKKRVSGINHCVCRWAFLGEMCLSDTFVCVGSSDTASLWVVVLAKSVWMERQAHTWNIRCFWPMMNGCYYPRGRSPICQLVEGGCLVFLRSSSLLRS